MLDASRFVPQLVVYLVGFMFIGFWVAIICHALRDWLKEPEPPKFSDQESMLTDQQPEIWARMRIPG